MDIFNFEEDKIVNSGNDILIPTSPVGMRTLVIIPNFRWSPPL